MELSVAEADRLAALYNYGVLDTDFEERFDRLTRVAATVFGTTIALISLVDKDRQWFKAALGLKVRETARDISFCTHAILGTDVFVVRDAHQDARFSRNPLVTGEPHIRFYAGAPMLTRKGHALGTFCVIDRAPRNEFTVAQQETLKDFAATVVDFFEMQVAIREGRAKRVSVDRALAEIGDELSQLSGSAPSQELKARLENIADKLGHLQTDSKADRGH